MAFCLLDLEYSADRFFVYETGQLQDNCTERCFKVLNSFKVSSKPYKEYSKFSSIVYLNVA